MNDLYVFFYFMKREPEKIGATVPDHIAYWKALNADGYKGGAFGDKSGGLITFEADSLEAAEKIVENDPFILQELLADKWIKKWDAK